MSNAILFMVGVLAGWALVCWLMDWHERTFVRRHRPMDAVCSPRVTRAWIRHWTVGSDAK